MAYDWRDMVNMTTRNRLLPWVPGVTGSTALAQLDGLITGYSRLVTANLDRIVKHREHTQYWDVRDFMSRVHLRAWPIYINPTTSLPTLAIYNDGAEAPTYGADTLLDYPSAYRVNTDERGQGRVDFRYALTSGAQALKAVWTGGMATRTSVEGTAATLANNAGPPITYTLTDATATFITDLVEAGMTVSITAPSGAVCTRTITVVVSETQLRVSESWPLAGAGNTWIVNEAGFVGRYPDIEEAVIAQCSFHWQMRDKLGIGSMSVSGGSGMNTTFTRFKPMELLPELQNVIDRYRLVKYP